jgi:hypothetical protein
MDIFMSICLVVVSFLTVLIASIMKCNDPEVSRVMLVQEELDRIRQEGTPIQEYNDMRHMRRLMALIGEPEEFEPCKVNWKKEGF